MNHIKKSLLLLISCLTFSFGVIKVQASIPQGNAIASANYVTITSSNYSIYQNFNWKIKGNTNSIINKTVRVRCLYHHKNGTTYDSIYDHDKWLGYLDARATSIAPNRGGIPHQFGHYVTINKKNYFIWNNLNFDKAIANSSQVYHQKFLSKSYFNAYSGMQYVSLTNTNCKLVGYINKGAVSQTITPSKIMMYGDSYTVRATPTLKKMFGTNQITTECEIGISYNQASKWFQNGIPAKYGAVVYALGTNKPYPTISNIQNAMNLAKGRQVYWVNAYTLNLPDSIWSSVNSNLNTVARRYPNMHIVDWRTVGKNNPKLFDTDRIHPNWQSGVYTWSKLLYNAVLNDTISQ